MAELAAGVQTASSIWSAAGVGVVGNVAYLTTGGTGLVATEGADIDALRATDPGGDPRAVNLFFIIDFSDEAGTLGLAAGVPGPMGVLGTAGSGVVLSILSHLDLGGVLDTTLLGNTMAHEVAHQLGLFHTTEPDGLDWDYLPDTPECTTAQDTNSDGFVDADECAAYDGANLMFWIATDTFVQEDVSPIQADILRLSPVVY